jgi:hypothetical protein
MPAPDDRISADEPERRPQPGKPPPRPRAEDEEDEPPRPRRRRQDDDDDDDDDDRPGGDPVATIIPYRNGFALAAYYCGVFGLIPCLGLLLGPTALTLGILGWRYVARHPEAKGTAHAVVGIVLGVLATLGNWGVLIFTGAGLFLTRGW